MRGEKIYEYDAAMTGTDYGIPMDAVLSGEVQIPPQGVRIDLDIRATIETGDGSRIALSADGVAIPRATEPVADISENVILSTASAEHAWVNTRQIWCVGTVEFATGKIHVEAYMQ